jgi:alpha-L-arabinofuranosidase
MMKPENHILMANFWQFANEYWGMVQGNGPQGRRPVKQANFFPYQLYHEHFGDTLIKADVQCAQWDFAGAADVSARTGQPRQYKFFEKNLLPNNYKWTISRSDSAVKQTIEGKIAVAEFQGEDVNFFYPYLKIPAEPLTGYRVTGYIKTDNLIDNAGVSFEVEDARGWLATRSSAMGDRVKGTSEWTKVQVDYVTPSGADGIVIIARRLSGNGPVTGKAYFRMESVQKFQPANTGAVPDLGVNSAKRADGTVTVMIVNKNTEEPVPVYLKIGGANPRTNAAEGWLLSGPSCFANNLKDPNSVSVSKVEVGINNESYYLKMPPCSMAALEIKP